MKNFKKSIMGTIEFDAKFPGMRKEQNFIVYPMNGNADTILIQSESRWAEIDAETGEAFITSSQSGHHNRWMLAMQKASGKAKKFSLSAVELSELKMHIFTTAGKKVGSSFVYSDNSKSFNII